MAVPDRIARTRAGLRGRWWLRRQLARIGRGLAKDATLAAKFAMFNALTKGEPPSGAEPLPRFRWQLPRFGWPLTLLAARHGPAGKRSAWGGSVVAMAAMLAVLVAGLLFGLAMRPAARTCLMLASAGERASAAASATPSKAGQPAAASAASVASEAAGGFVRGPAATCPAYPAKK